MDEEHSDRDIEAQINDSEHPVPGNTKSIRSCCCLTAFNVIGGMANIIRTIICIGLFVSAVIVILIACNVFVDALVSSKILYAIFAVVLIGGIMMAFDGSTAQWLVQKVLNELAADVTNLEHDIKVFETQLTTSAAQIKQRENQLQQSAEQLRKQETVIADLKTVQANMSVLVTSLVACHKDGEDLNALFAEHLQKFEQQLARMEKAEAVMENQIFEVMDKDHNNAIDPNEFRIYISSTT